MQKQPTVQLLSAIRDPFLVRLPARDPIVVGTTESRSPAPSLELRPFVPAEVSERGATLVIARHGRRGIVQLQDDETVEQATGRAKVIRHSFLRAQVNHFRRVNADLRARGLAILMPTDELRGHLYEMKRLDAELFPDARELDAPARGAVEDIAQRELSELGIPPGAASLTPGVEPGLSDIADSPL